MNSAASLSSAFSALAWVSVRKNPTLQVGTLLLASRHVTDTAFATAVQGVHVSDVLRHCRFNHAESLKSHRCTLLGCPLHCRRSQPSDRVSTGVQAVHVSMPQGQPCGRSVAAICDAVACVGAGHSSSTWHICASTPPSAVVARGFSKTTFVSGLPADSARHGNTTGLIATLGARI